MRAPARRPRRRRPVVVDEARRAAARRLFDHSEDTLLDLVDNILNKGLMITGDVVLSLAEVELVYLRVSALVCAADKVLPGVRYRWP